MNNQLSNCHQAPTTIGGDDTDPLGGTHYYVCSACGEACDLYFDRDKFLEAAAKVRPILEREGKVEPQAEDGAEQPDVYTVANKVVEIFADSFKFPNERNIAEANLIAMGRVIEEYVAQAVHQARQADREGLVELVEAQWNGMKGVTGHDEAVAGGSAAFEVSLRVISDYYDQLQGGSDGDSK